MVIVAALFVQRNGVYFNVDGVDPWDQRRDARRYAGPFAVVAHPPCARWCRLAGLVEHRYGLRRGDDGGCFASALASVREWGGVLEHPADSTAFAAYGIARPMSGSWQKSICGGWTTEVAQVRYGHRARKRTWLYYVGNDPPPLLDWSVSPHCARLSYLQNRSRATVPMMGAKEGSATPHAFRDLLIEMARGAKTDADLVASIAAGKKS